VVASAVVWSGTGRRLRLHGIEKLQGLGPESRVLVVANHRSFFDFFGVAWTLICFTRLPRRFFFPVRSNFFYDTLLGGIVNLLFTGFAMYPPVMRAREQSEFNKYSARLMAELLAQQGTVVAIHPEGTRNQSADPWSLRPKLYPGAGRLALEVPEAAVIPVWVMGYTNNPIKEIWRNWMQPEAHPVHICFGEAIRFDDLRRQRDIAEEGAPQQDLGMEATERAMEHVHQLGQELRQRLEQPSSEAQPAPAEQAA
jgi:1-acyl-sn-glycerol-3-phosphate acyltransferase